MVEHGSFKMGFLSHQPQKTAKELANETLQGIDGYCMPVGLPGMPDTIFQSRGGLLMRRSIAVMVAAAFVGMSSFAAADDLGMGKMSEGMKQDMGALSDEVNAHKEELKSDLKAKKDSVKSELKAKRD